MSSTNSHFRYYLNGDFNNLLYPAGIPQYESWVSENSAGSVAAAGDNQNSYLSSVTHTPSGNLASAVVGWVNSGYSGNIVSNTYNNRLQPVTLSDTTSTGAPILNLSYNFNLGNGTSGTDNGNVIQVINGKDNNRTQNFTYDALNRIASAYTTGPNWGESYTIDAWGNMYSRSGVSGKTNFESLSCAPNVKNQLNTCVTYDAAGNVIKNGPVTYTYDAENRLISTAGMSYVYDGDGNRVEKCTAGATPGTCAANATGRFYWWLSGSVFAESDLSVNFTAAYGLIRGQIGARIDLPSNTIHYYFHDHLGSTDVVTDALGNVQNESDYYPYGGEIPILSGDTNRYKFNGKERDAESGLDNFGARFDTSAMGRFMTPDWAAKPTTVPYANFGNPQSLNLYSYVENNPTTLGDPDGHQQTDCARKGQCGCDPGDQQCGSNQQEQFKEQFEEQAEQHQLANLARNDMNKRHVRINGKPAYLALWGQKDVVVLAYYARFRAALAAGKVIAVTGIVAGGGASGGRAGRLRQLFGTEGSGAITNNPEKAAEEALARIKQTKGLPEGLTQEDLDYYKQVMEQAARSPNNPNRDVQAIRGEIIKTAEEILQNQ